MIVKKKSKFKLKKIIIFFDKNGIILNYNISIIKKKIKAFKNLYGRR
jgi:transketolase